MVLDIAFVPGDMALRRLKPLDFVWPKLGGKWLKPAINEGFCFEKKFEIAVRTMNFIIF